MRVLIFLWVLLVLRCAVADGPAPVVGSPTMISAPRWSRVSWTEGPAPRRFCTATPTSAGVLIFGGSGSGGELADAWRWDGERWSALDPAGAPSARVGHTAVWVGDQLCVWGGARARRPLDDGACWNSRTGRWRSMSSDGAPGARRRHGAVEVGGRMMLFGGFDDEGEALADGALYDPALDRWTPLGEGAPRPRADPWMLTHGERVAVLGGVGEALALGADDGAWYDPAVARWSPMALVGGPLAREGAVLARATGALVALGERAWRFDGDRGGWAAAHQDGAPGRRWSAAVAAIPGGVAVWGGTDGGRSLSDGARYDLATDRWAPLPREGAPPPRTDATAFFDGERLMLLWGSDGDALCADAWSLPVGPGG